MEVAFDGGDGFELTGGTVNLKYISSILNGDDAIDVDLGYQVLLDRCDCPATAFLFHVSLQTCETVFAYTHMCREICNLYSHWLLEICPLK